MPNFVLTNEIILKEKYFLISPYINLLGCEWLMKSSEKNILIF